MNKKKNNKNKKKKKNKKNKKKKKKTKNKKAHIEKGYVTLEYDHPSMTHSQKK